MSAVVTEDSDLLAFGVTDVFFKMDRSGNGIRIDLNELKEVPEFSNFSGDMLLYTSILSGCDYLESLKGIGLKKAARLVKDTGADLKAILRHIRREGKHLIPLEYETQFMRALLTFKFQRVYCPLKRDLVHLTEPDELPSLKKALERQGDTNFLGEPMSKDLATRVCIGELNPLTKGYFSQLLPAEGKRSGTMKVFTAKKTKQSKYQLDVEQHPQGNNLANYWRKAAGSNTVTDESAVGITDS